MGMLQQLLQIYERLDASFDYYTYKLDIIKNNIFGVDIEPMAVEIARLRAWLAIVVAEDSDKSKLEPLPNLDFKFVCANTLIPLEGKDEQGFLGDDPDLEDNIMEIRSKYYNARTQKTKEEMRKKYGKLIEQKRQKELFGKSKRQEQIETYHPFDSKNVTRFFDPDFMFGVKGFDIVVGNPPYVSTKGRSSTDKENLIKHFGFVDDLYNHFYFRGLDLLRSGGILTYISSKTFWTIQTKKNLRGLLQKNRIIEIFDTANPFEAPMVDTCIVFVQKCDTMNYEMRFKDGLKDLLHPDEYTIKVSIYREAVNQIIFKPTSSNLKIYSKYNSVVKKLMDQWWGKISTSKNITKNMAELERYRKTLRPGDITLLGLITDGGQGLATANNGKYVGVLEGTKFAESVKASRPIKLAEAVVKYNIKELAKICDEDHAEQYLAKKKEMEIRELFDNLKEKYERDIFGQGYLHRIVSVDEIADIGSLSKDEKENGISGKKTYVPYDKGDKDGTRWYLRTPYYIDWRKENVSFLKDDPNARWQGQQFYFKEGFCWINVLNPNARLIKCRLKSKSVNDVGAMSLTSTVDELPSSFFACLINSNLLFDYYRNFINQSVNVQINDIRQLPIAIPNAIQKKKFLDIFHDAYIIQEQRFDGAISDEVAEKRLVAIQAELDQKVLSLYGITDSVSMAKGTALAEKMPYK
jgi:hypothetical protein